MLPVAAKTGAAALRANPVRALLATLGIVIGSGALVAVLAVGDGVEQYARVRAIEQGLDRVTVRPITDDTVDGQLVRRTTIPALGPRDLSGLATALQPGETATLTQRGVLLLHIGRPPRQRAITVEAVALDDAPAPVRALAAGRDLTPDETRAGAPVGVVNPRLARALLADTTAPAAQALGDSIPVGGVWLEIVGILADGQQAPPTRNDLRMIAPIERVAPYFVDARATEAWPSLVVRTSDPQQTLAMKARVESWLASRDPAWRRTFRVDSRAEWQLAEVERGMLLFRLFMGAITGITLVVGGIGIMNVLLASVAERTREIGVRKAVGARRRDILLQFLAESVTITATGGVVGTALGFATAYAVTAVMRAETSAIIYAAVTPHTVLLSVGIAVVVGIAFGCYPAARAARLPPIEAIHVE